MSTLKEENYEVFQNVLTIGPEYKNNKGGVGAVIDIYSKYFNKFNFISSYKPGSLFLKFWVFIIGLCKYLVLMIFSPEIKIIHIHGASRGSFFRKYIFFRINEIFFKKKIIYHIHGGEYHLFYEESNDFVKRRINHMLNNVDLLICLSESWKSYFNNNFQIKKIEIIPNIVDFPIKTEMKKGIKKVNFLFLGYINSGKGIYDIIDTITQYTALFDGNIELWIGGIGETDVLKKKIKVNELESIVKFFGWVNGQKKMDLLNGCDVYILPSYNEGLPISILEAMSFSKPVISCPVGGIPEIVKNNENGILVEPGNLEELKNAILTFIDNPRLLREYGDRSSKLVQKHYPSSVMSELNKNYKSLINE